MYNVHLLESERQAVYRERERKKRLSCVSTTLAYARVKKRKSQTKKTPYGGVPQEAAVIEQLQ